MKVVVVPVTPFEQNCTLLIGDDGAAAVTDPGGDIERILESIDARLSAQVANAANTPL